MSQKLLYLYRCKACLTVATNVVRASPRCNGCHRYMAFLFTRPIETDDQRTLAARGIVYNPGVSQEPTR
jgi:hypothetical protein